MSDDGSDSFDDFDDDFDDVADIGDRPSGHQSGRWEQPFSIPHAASEFTGSFTAPSASNQQRLSSRQTPASASQEPATPDVTAAADPLASHTPDVPHGRPEPPQPEAVPATRNDDEQSGGNPRRRRLVAAVVAVVVALVVVTGAVVFVLRDAAEPGEMPIPAAAPPPSSAATTTTTAAAPADDCPDSTQGGVVRGNSSGGQDSGPAVIMAFNYAYYVTRSGAAAKAVTTPGAVADADVIQGFIDKIPAGTHYCLLIEPAATGTVNGPNTYRVTLTEMPPTELGQPAPTPTVIPQTIETTQAAGKTWITAIRKRED